MRSSCPRAWTEKHGGYWVATRYSDVVGIAQNPDKFNSGKKVDPETGEMRGGLSITPSPLPAIIPDETDQPEWSGYRQFLNRRFAPKAAEEFRGLAEGLARTLIDRVIESGQFDIVEDLASPLPALVTMRLFGFDLENWRAFADPIHKLAYMSASDPGYLEALAGVEAIWTRIAQEAEDRRIKPRDDLMSYIVNGEIDGRKIEALEAIQMTMNIVYGGVDTTTALTSNALRYLAHNPGERQKLIDDPSLLRTACEEFVRYFSPVHGLARHAADDLEFKGWQFAKGDRILIAYASANRDDAVFEAPEEVRLDRFPNRHVGFGAGMHRCLGSFYARLMFTSMIKEVLSRMPDYRIDDAEALPYPAVSNVNGWINMPATFTPGPRLGGGYDLHV